MILTALLLVSTCIADTTDDRRSDLLSAVEGYVSPLNLRWDASSARVEWTDLTGDGRDDALVTLEGADWCGSGGCTLLVFEAMDEIDREEWGPYRPAAEISHVAGPVTVVGGCGYWASLVVGSESGARVLHFDGETYPPSPSDGMPLSGPPPPGATFFVDGQ